MGLLKNLPFSTPGDSPLRRPYVKLSSERHPEATTAPGCARFARHVSPTAGPPFARDGRGATDRLLRPVLYLISIE